jgi:hypothetical protein
MSQPSEIAVVVVWLNPNQNLSLYPQILDGFRVERTLRRPSMEYYFFKSEAEAQKLKSHLEQNLPSHDYRALDVANHPILDKVGNPLICREPRIDIVVFARAATPSQPKARPPRPGSRRS